MSNFAACSIRFDICKHSQTLASAGYSPNGRSHTACSVAVVTASAVANKVASIPFFTRASVNTDTTCSQGPYLRGGVLQVMGARIATFTQNNLYIQCSFFQRAGNYYMRDPVSQGTFGSLIEIDPFFMQSICTTACSMIV